MSLFFACIACIAAVLIDSPMLRGQTAYSIHTVAGSDWVGENVPATQGILIQTEGITADNVGNIYIADAAEHRIRQVTPSGLIRTIAGNGIAGFAGDGGPASAAQLNSPYGLAFDTRGNLYITDLGNARVRKIAPDGTISTIAGGGTLPAGGANDGSPATSLALSAPRNVAADPFGNIYISDFTAHRAYRLAADATLSTLAGTGVAGFSGDGAALNAQLNYPTAIAADQMGTVYIADSQNHLIRKVVNGRIYTIGRATLPTGLTLDALQTLYVADRSAGQILRIPVSGTATSLNVIAHDLVFGMDGNLYAANATVMSRISLSGNATVVAGPGNLAEGDGAAATLARLNHPSGIAIDVAGNLYIADRDNNRIRRVAPNGTITTLISSLNAPASITIGPTGLLYVADTGNHRVLVVTPAGVSSPLSIAGLVSPVCAVGDQAGNVYIADSSNGTIVKLAPNGTVTTLFSGLQSPRGLALDTSGNLFFTETAAKRVWMLAPIGDHSMIVPGAWSAPQGIAISSSGSIFVADSGLQQVVQVDSKGQAAMIAGSGTGGFTGDGGAALAAQLSSPSDIAIDTAGNLYIADQGNNRIRQLTPGLTGTIGGQTLVVSAVNAASLLPGPLAPGMLLALENTGLTSASASQTQILFNTIPAPILSIDPTRILVRVPVELADAQSVTITINNQNAPIAQITANLVDAAPGLFTNAIGQAAATNQDGTLNSASNPASRGTIITLYGTGEGVTGLPLAVTIGGYFADILYAGPVAAYPGIFQINAVIPSGYFQGGAMEVVVTAGTAQSQPGVAIVVN